MSNLHKLDEVLLHYGVKGMKWDKTKEELDDKIKKAKKKVKKKSNNLLKDLGIKKESRSEKLAEATGFKKKSKTEKTVDSINKKLKKAGVKKRTKTDTFNDALLAMFGPGGTKIDGVRVNPKTGKRLKDQRSDSKIREDAANKVLKDMGVKGRFGSKAKIRSSSIIVSPPKNKKKKK